MKMPKLTKSAIVGFLLGAVFMPLVGFNYMGWMLAGDAHKMANELSQSAVTDTHITYCVAAAEDDPEFTARKDALEKETGRYDQGKLLEGYGWADTPDGLEPKSDVLSGCAEEVLAES